MVAYRYVLLLAVVVLALLNLQFSLLPQESPPEEQSSLWVIRPVEDEEEKSRK